MSTFWKTCVIAGLVSGLGLPAIADPRPKGAVTPVELNEYGLPVVKVRLSSKKPGVPDREFRFIFDTGATLNTIDVSVPADFFWEESDKPKGVTGTAVDGTGTAITTRIVILKRLEVAQSGYYEWLKQPISDRAQEDARLLRLIRAAFTASHGIYGAPRIFLNLREEGETCSKHRVARLMRVNNLRALHGYRTRRWSVGKPAVLIPNILQRQFTVTRPNNA